MLLPPVDVTGLGELEGFVAVEGELHLSLSDELDFPISLSTIGCNFPLTKA